MSRAYTPPYDYAVRNENGLRIDIAFPLYTE